MAKKKTTTKKSAPKKTEKEETKKPEPKKLDIKGLDPEKDFNEGSTVTIESKSYIVKGKKLQDKVTGEEFIY